MTRILVVGDATALRGIVCYLLENAGYEVVEAGDGSGRTPTVSDRAELST
jgi:CheY-like chemotaxis protein